MQAELLRIGSGGVVPVRWELAKAEEDPGTITGWASVYNVIDQQDDVVVPGAFTKSLADWRKTGRVIPLTLDHQNNAEGVIGSLAKAQDTSYGLRTTFKFASTDDAQRARTKAREGHLNGLSMFGGIINKSIDMVGDRAVRLLKEVSLMVVGLTPFPANLAALVTAAKSVVDAAWDGSQLRFTAEQWRRSCLIDTGQGDATAKSRYTLPIREPNGDINRSAVHAAAGGVAAVTGISDEVRRTAARKLVGLYRNDLKEDPPAGLLTAAGMASASLVLPDAWVSDMRAALAISVPTARKAAVDVLVAEQYQLGAVDLDGDDAGAGGDAPGDEAEAEVEDAAQYALSLIGDAPPEPSVDDLLAGIDNVSTAHLTTDLDALAAELANR